MVSGVEGGESSISIMGGVTKGWEGGGFVGAITMFREGVSEKEGEELWIESDGGNNACRIKDLGRGSL